MTFDISFKSSLSPPEAAETIEMTETAANEEQHQQIPRENKGNSKDKRSKQMWGTIMIKTFGDQENRTNSYGIKGTSVLLTCT